MATLRQIFASDAGAASAYAHRSEPLSKLLQFLESPEWITRTDDYFEQESIMFDPSVTDSDLYKQIHENYKTMVDKMLVDFRTNTHMSPEVVQASVEDAKKQAQTNRIVKELVQPLLLYEDYELFKQTMMNQNIELQTFAMESIQKKTGSFPFSRATGATPEPMTYQGTDDALLELVLKRSKEEYDALQRRIQEEEDALERALRESERIAELLASQSKVSVHDLKALVQQMEVLSTVSEEEERPETAISNDKRPPPTVTITSALAQENPDDFVSVKQFISPEELKRRQNYLRAQRDKLLSKKEALRASEEASNLTVTQAKARASTSATESRKKLAEKLKTELGDKHGV